MALFQTPVLNKYINNLDLAKVDKAWEVFKAHFHNPKIQDNIRASKEEQYQSKFIDDLFVKVLDYIQNPEPNFNITTEYKNVKDSKKADGAIIINEKVLAVVELKGTHVTDLNKVELQAFNYKNNQPECIYVITSNFEKLRFYIDNAIEFIEFNLFELNRDDFELLYLCLHYQQIRNGIPKKIKDASIVQEEDITKKLYKDYSDFKRELFANLLERNQEYDSLEVFKKTQKLLDRFLFLFFAEDRGLIPPYSIRRIIREWKTLKDLDVYMPLIDRFRQFFGYINTGHKAKDYEIYAYNGGLFAPDEFIDKLSVDDELLYKYTILLADYDFQSEVDVNILGHIFENSLNEIDEIKAELAGETIDRKQTKRKKDGVFYTPKYITKYIVENTIGKHCDEKKQELNILEEEYASDKRKTKNKISQLQTQLTDYRNWLLDLSICDPACGSGAFLNQALDFLIAEHKYIDELEAKLFGDSIVYTDIEISILENNLYGVDINEESVDIAKLSLWLRTAQANRKLNDLNNNLKCGNSLIENPEIAGEKAFNWEKEFPQVFKKGGFDIIIGNPPYVQLQKIKPEGLEHYNTYARTGDLYCIFYELGNMILKENGSLGFITSNKWLRANYGKSLRNYLLNSTQLNLLIDLGADVFESATVDSNILIFRKGKTSKQEHFYAADITKEKSFDPILFESQKVKMFPEKNKIWNIANPLELQIKNKIEKQATKLKNWDISINYGLKTGLNAAFIITEEKRAELISKDSNSAQVIFPVLRGRDIDRYKMNYQNLYLINTHNGYADIPAINIDDYPAIKEHLLEFEPQLSKRYDKGSTPFNLRNCAYNDDFFKDKIIWKEMSSNTPFYYDTEAYFTNDTVTFIVGNDLKYLLTLLNSKLKLFIYANFYAGGGLGTSGIRFKKNFLQELPVKHINQKEQQVFINKADEILDLHKEQQAIGNRFLNLLQSEFGIEGTTNRLEAWYKHSYSDFTKELSKLKVNLSLAQKAEWMEFFETEKKKALDINIEIEETDKEIDQMVYKLYELTEEEIKIVEEA